MADEIITYQSYEDLDKRMLDLWNKWEIEMHERYKYLPVKQNPINTETNNAVADNLMWLYVFDTGHLERPDEDKIYAIKNTLIKRTTFDELDTILKSYEDMCLHGDFCPTLVHCTCDALPCPEDGVLPGNYVTINILELQHDAIIYGKVIYLDNTSTIWIYHEFNPDGSVKITFTDGAGGPAMYVYNSYVIESPKWGGVYGSDTNLVAGTTEHTIIINGEPPSYPPPPSCSCDIAPCSCF